MASTMPDSPPSSALVHHPHCPLCGGTAAAYLQDTRDLHYGIAGLWNYERCRDCGVVFLNPAPTQEFLASAYDDSYYSYQDFSPEPRLKRWLRRVFFFAPGATGDPLFARPGRVLDIGCGSGEFLYRMKQAGWRTHGVELSGKAARIGNEHYQLNIHAGTLSSASLLDGDFDYIRLNHSFEHIPDPLPTLALIHRLLAADGLLFIGVPNVDGWQARAFGKHWWNLGPPVHPFNYSRRTLTRMLEQHGFDVIRFRTNSNFAGILGSLQMARNDRAGVYRDSGRLTANPLARLLSQWLSKLIDLFAAGDCLEIIARKRPAAETSRG
jgi:SAM-dependent methyltransferase